MYQSWFKTKNVCVECIHSVKDPFPILSAYVDKMDQIFPPPIFAYCKNWTVGRPGNEAKTSLLYNTVLCNFIHFVQEYPLSEEELLALRMDEVRLYLALYPGPIAEEVGPNLT